MIHGFDSPLICEGIIGDGCGGDRIFFIKDDSLNVYDKNTKKSIILLEDIKNAKKIYKKACVIFIECQNELIKFDLSLMTKS
jgi:hypothetical protein